LKSGIGIEGRVTVENKAHFVESVSKDVYDHKIWVDKEKLQALAAVPITRPSSKSNGQNKQTNSNVIGVLAAGKRSQSYVWTPREVRLLTSIANQVALAIDNARLYAQVQEGEVGLRVGNQILQEINDMLLEKNANLEGFIQHDLNPALTMASQILQGLTKDPTTLSDEQKKNTANLGTIVDRLGKLAKETSAMSETLDSAFDEVLDAENKKDYAGSIRPLRLEKRTSNKAESTNVEEDDIADSKPVPPEQKQNNDTVSKPMNFEEAVAAGLVPDNILNRETKAQKSPPKT
jgi:K+-sensing histidine kinase KdpD